MITLRPITERTPNPMPVGSTKSISASGKPVYTLPAAKSTLKTKISRAGYRPPKVLAGMCSVCHRPRGDSPSRWRCASCQAKLTEYSRAKSQAALAAGSCRRCLKRPIAKGSYCTECIEKILFRNHELYEARRAEKMCIECGEEAERYTRCLPCRRKHAAKRRRPRLLVSTFTNDGLVSA